MDISNKVKTADVGVVNCVSSTSHLYCLSRQVEQNWYPRPENGPLDERLRKAYRYRYSHYPVLPMLSLEPHIDRVIEFWLQFAASSPVWRTTFKPKSEATSNIYSRVDYSNISSWCNREIFVYQINIYFQHLQIQNWFIKGNKASPNVVSFEQRCMIFFIKAPPAIETSIREKVARLFPFRQIEFLRPFYALWPADESRCRSDP